MLCSVRMLSLINILRCRLIERGIYSGGWGFVIFNSSCGEVEGWSVSGSRGGVGGGRRVGEREGAEHVEKLQDRAADMMDCTCIIIADIYSDRNNYRIFVFFHYKCYLQ